MPFTVPTLDEMTDQLVADFANRFPNANVSKFSDNWKRIRNLALATTSLHRHAKVVGDDSMPDRAGGTQLDRHGSIYGVTRKPATPAKKADALRITGTVASAITTGDQLSSSDGLLFKVNETTAIPVAGFIDVDVIGVDVGSATRKSEGEVLRFVATPAGLDQEAILQADLDEDGDDEESDGAYRVRILDTIAQPGMGGNSNDFRQWALEVTGVATAYVWPLRGGLGSVHLAALKSGTGAARIPTVGEVAEVQAYIDARRPVGYEDFLVLTTVAEPNNVEMRIDPEDDASFAFDWDDTTPLVVSTWTGATRILKFTTPRPVDMAVGDRLIHKRLIGTLNDGHEHTIEAFGAADEVVLKADAEFATAPPDVGTSVYSGGPLVAPVREAIVAHIDSLGPGRADSVVPGQDFSDGGSSTWEGTLRTSKLHNVSQQQDGVLDTVLVTPAANVTPANIAPNPTVGFITARQTIVRKL